MEIGRISEIERLKNLSEGRRRIWMAHNLGRTLRAPTPLTWDIVRKFMSGDGGFGRFYQDLGYRPSPQVCKEGLFGADRGSHLRRSGPRGATFLGQQPAPLRPRCGAQGQYLAGPGSDKVRAGEGRWKVLPPAAGNPVVDVPRIAACQAVAEHDSRPLRADRIAALPRLCSAEACGGPFQAGNAAGLRRAAARCVRVLDEFGKESFKPGFFGAWPSPTCATCSCNCWATRRAAGSRRRFTTGLEGDTTVAQNQLLYRVAQGKVAMQQFLDAYGHRTAGEMELANRTTARILTNSTPPCRPCAAATARRSGSTRTTPSGGRRLKRSCPPSWPAGAAVPSASRSRRVSARPSGCWPIANRASTT